MTNLRLTICGIFWILITTVQAQIFTPVKWTTNYQKIKANTYDLFITADIDSSWSLYGEKQSSDGPTSFYAEVEKTQNIIVKEQLKPISNPIVSFDNVFQMVTRKFKNKAVFKLRVTIINPNKSAIIKFYWEYMSCNDERCIPPTERCAKFTFKPENPQTKTIRAGKLSIVDCDN